MSSVVGMFTCIHNVNKAVALYQYVAVCSNKVFCGLCCRYLSFGLVAAAKWKPLRARSWLQRWEDRSDYIPSENCAAKNGSPIIFIIRRKKIFFEVWSYTTGVLSSQLNSKPYSCVHPLHKSLGGPSSITPCYSHTSSISLFICRHMVAYIHNHFPSARIKSVVVCSPNRWKKLASDTPTNSVNSPLYRNIKSNQVFVSSVSFFVFYLNIFCVGFINFHWICIMNMHKVLS